MLNSNHLILRKNNIQLGFIKEFFLKCSSGSLCIYAETINTAGARKCFTVVSISSSKDKTYIDLEEIDYTQTISDSEKLIDIREFLNKPKS